MRYEAKLTFSCNGFVMFLCTRLPFHNNAFLQHADASWPTFPLWGHNSHYRDLDLPELSNIPQRSSLLDPVRRRVVICDLRGSRRGRFITRCVASRRLHVITRPPT